MLSLTFVAAAKADFYETKGEWKDQTGKAVKISDLRGKNTVVVLFYTQCQTICPMTVNNLKSLEKKLGEKDLQFLLVSIQPKEDTTEKLKEFVKTHKIEKWKLITGTESNVKKLVGPLEMGMSDRPGNTDLHQMHSQQFALIDKNGKFLMSAPTAGADVDKVKQALQATVKTAAR